MASLLQMTGITKRFPGVVANRHIDLDVRRGEVLGLLGENGAGKTTLMNILYGLLQPDEGTIHIDGQSVRIRSPRDAISMGIGMIHQHFMLVPNMTVAENLALGLRSTRGPLAPLRQIAAQVRMLSERYGLMVGPEDRVENLSVGTQQRVEIIKLLHRGARLLILDEPTSVLTPLEWKQLAVTLRSLVAEGRSAIFITHKLDEVLSVADRVTVLRDGAVVGTVDSIRADKASLARMMVGRDVVLRVNLPPARPGRPVLEVRGLKVLEAGRPRLNNISFSLAEGETLGIAGVEGNGQQELVEALTGQRRLAAGCVTIDGKPLVSTREFANLSVGLIPADRHATGLAPDLPLSDNLIMRDVGKHPLSRRGVLSQTAIRAHCQRLMAEYDIRAPSPTVLIRQLSGGNQQKAVLARELHRKPKLLIAAQPTRGLDVGAMEFVYQHLLHHRASGGATLLISTELDEILGLCDRIAVMDRGQFKAILPRQEASLDRLGLLMAGEDNSV